MAQDICYKIRIGVIWTVVDTYESRNPLIGDITWYDPLNSNNERSRNEFNQTKNIILDNMNGSILIG